MDSDPGTKSQGQQTVSMKHPGFKEYNDDDEGWDED